MVSYLAYRAVPLLVDTALVTLGPYTCMQSETYLSEQVAIGNIVPGTRPKLKPEVVWGGDKLCQCGKSGIWIV